MVRQEPSNTGKMACMYVLNQAGGMLQIEVSHLTGCFQFRLLSTTYAFLVEGDGRRPETAASSCFNILKMWHTKNSTAYWINPKRTNDPNDALLVYCDVCNAPSLASYVKLLTHLQMETDGGGWTLVGYAENGAFR
jgi:hypothetical protein